MIAEYEVDLARAQWRKSARSSASRDCVEVALLGGGLVGVRDSKNPTGPALVFTSREWNTFTHSVIDGELWAATTWGGL
ncbi:DUF397 domain-containing protein [Nocardia sp. CA-129566]|uniref:DUF397 domain-containing protein n=1 Tax=Nocardia sp. CA-129566 TaxID=3239976 RepID=UPI003D95B681